jgi:tRNA N6-adenosine threonylcarbamoyltransferase
MKPLPCGLVEGGDKAPQDTCGTRYSRYDFRAVIQGKADPVNRQSPRTLVLGIETSCDETAAAVVSSEGRILSNIVLSQIEDHRPYGGVVPEIAARAHVEHLDRLIARAMSEAGISFGDLDAIAATAGPGLIGGVLVGLMTGKALAASRGLPFLAINHLEAHALSARLLEEVGFPYLLLLVSGGHCQLVRVSGVGDYQRLGTTIDDAVGEAFDKVAKILGLGYPGGPAVERVAKTSDSTRFALPRPMLGRAGCDFSFSGLKTAVKRLADELAADHAISDADVADIAAGFQAAVGDILADRTARAMDRAGPMSLVIAGGVAANSYLRARLGELCRTRNDRLIAPPIKLCTDNGAMVAWAGIERLALGLTDDLDAPARARWPLDGAAIPRLGEGRKGAKA